MDKRKQRDAIQHALNSTLSGLQDDPWLTQRVIVQAKGEIKVKKKISTGLILIFVLMMITATALAVATIREIAQMMAQTEQEVGWFVDWPVEKKTTVIATLTEQGYIPKSDDVRQLLEGSLSPDDAGCIADKLVSDFTGRDIEDVSFLVIMQAAWGPFDSWSDENRAWYSALMEDVGVENDGKTVYVLPKGEISKEEAVKIAKRAVASGYRIEENALDAYRVIVNFQVPEFAELDDDQPYWYVMFEAPEDMEDILFHDIELFIHPQTGELLQSVEEILARHENLPKRPNNNLYQAIDTYSDRAREMGAYSFREWPLELRAEYSQNITPKIKSILESGDLHDLMNCGNLDIAVIAQSTYVYGIPSKDAITQEDAYALAIEALMDTYDLPSDLFDKYSEIDVYYDITNEPMWKFFFNPKSLNTQELEDGFDNPLFDLCYKVEIDALTGNVIYTEEFAFQTLGHDLEYDLKWY